MSGWPAFLLPSLTRGCTRHRSFARHVWCVTAQLNIFNFVPAKDVVNYAPKLVLYDIVHQQTLRTFVFPSGTSLMSPLLASHVRDVRFVCIGLSVDGARGGWRL